MQLCEVMYVAYLFVLILPLLILFQFVRFAGLVYYLEGVERKGRVWSAYPGK